MRLRVLPLALLATAILLRVPSASAESVCVPTGPGSYACVSAGVDPDPCTAEPSSGGVGIGAEAQVLALYPLIYVYANGSAGAYCNNSSGTVADFRYVLGFLGVSALVSGVSVSRSAGVLVWQTPSVVWVCVVVGCLLVPMP